jgi:hypothetical protein
MLSLSQDKTLLQLLQDEVEIVSSYWKINEVLDIRVPNEVLEGKAIDQEDYRDCLIARSSTHDYLFVIEDAFGLVLGNGQVWYDIQATLRGSVGGTSQVSMQHRGLTNV